MLASLLDNFDFYNAKRLYTLFTIPFWDPLSGVHRGRSCQETNSISLGIRRLSSASRLILGSIKIRFDCIRPWFLLGCNILARCSITVRQSRRFSPLSEYADDIEWCAIGQHYAVGMIKSLRNSNNGGSSEISKKVSSRKFDALLLYKTITIDRPARS